MALAINPTASLIKKERESVYIKERARESTLGRNTREKLRGLRREGLKAGLY